MFNEDYAMTENKRTSNGNKEMDLDQNIIEEHLWETFQIDFHKKIREEINKTPDDEKNKINRRLILNNFFLIRRSRDPGFFLHVMENIGKDTDLQKLVKKYISSLFPNPINHEFFSKNVEKRKSHETLVYKDNNPIEQNNKSINYFLRRFQDADERGDDNEALVIKQLVNDYKTGRYFGHQLFNTPSIYKDVTTAHKWMYSIKNYCIENIKFFEIYQIGELYESAGKAPPFESQLFNLISSKETFVTSLLNILNDLGDSPNLSFTDFIFEHHTFIKHSIFIAMVLWFERKTENEKIEILNKQYPFSIKNDMLEPYSKFGNDGYTILNNIAAELLTDTYLKEAEKIFDYIIEKCDDESIRYLCLDNKATLFREAKEYNNSHSRGFS
jgi:hypothetical protein